MQPSIDYQTATTAFVAAIHAPDDARPPFAEVARLCNDMNGKARMFSAWVPETTEGAAAKLECAAKAIEKQGFIDADMLATMAKGIASDLDSEEPAPALAGRLRDLLGYCECSVVLFRCKHGIRGDYGGAIEHIRTALTGLTTPRVIS